MIASIVFAPANTINMWTGLQSEETEFEASPLKGRKR